MTYKLHILIILLLISSVVWSQRDYDYFYNETKKELKNNNFRKAADYSLKGLQISPNDLDFKAYLGKSYLELGKLDSARYLLKKVVDNKKEHATSLRYLITTEELSERYSSAICYVNELLQVVPYDKNLWLKKVNIYNTMGNKEEAISTLKRLKVIFPKDENVKKTYNYFMMNKGLHFLKGNHINEAKEIYTNILKEEPTNKDAYLSLIKGEILSGNKQNALNITEKGLIIYPDNPDFIKKKIGLLEELGKFDEAIVYAKKKNNTKETTNTLKYLLNEASSFYKNRDPYELKKKEYEITRNKKLLIKIINTAIAKNQLDDATYYIQKGLKNNPNDKLILLSKLNLYTKTYNEIGYQKLLDTLHRLYPNNTDISEKYAHLSYQRGKTFLLQKDYKNAIKEFTFLTSKEDYKNLALENLFAIYEIQNKYESSLEKIDLLIANNKNNDHYFLKKSALYEKMGEYEKALTISKNLMVKMPETTYYKTIFVSESESYISFLMKNEQYDKALDVITEALLISPNKNLNNQAINASVAVKDYERALTFAEIAKTAYPNDKNFQLKLADVYAKNNDYDNALSTLKALYKKYPYSLKVKGSLSEIAFRKGKSLENQQQIDTAIVYYKYASELGEKDNPAIESVANLYLKNKEYQKVIDYINGLENTNNSLDYKKGVAFEQLKEYDSAFFYQKKHNPSIKEYKDWSKKINHLKFKSLKNELQFSYSENFSDSLDFKSALTSLRYTRFEKKNIYASEVNYVTRKNAIALQLNLGWSHIFNNSLYTQINYAISNTVFPKHKLSVSAFKGLKNDFEVQVGGRYAILNDTNLSTGILGVSKTMDDFWLNAKAFIFRDSDNNFYNNILLQSRYFLKNQDYFSLSVSAGTAPYEESLDFQSNTFLSYVNAMVGAGFNKQIHKNSFITINLNWYNYEVLDQLFSQQTNLTVVFKTRF